MWINYFSCRQQWTAPSSPTQVCICSVMTNYATWIDRPFFTVNYQFARRRGNIQIFIFTLHSSHLASSPRNTQERTLFYKWRKKSHFEFLIQISLFLRNENQPSVLSKNVYIVYINLPIYHIIYHIIMFNEMQMIVNSHKMTKLSTVMLLCVELIQLWH